MASGRTTCIPKEASLSKPSIRCSQTPSTSFPTPFNLKQLANGVPLEEADARRSRTDAQNRYLSAVARYAPEVLQDLASSPLTAYKAVLSFSSLFDRTTDQLALTWMDLLALPSTASPPLLALRQSLQHWTTRHHLTAAWCGQRALETLDLWERVHSPCPPRNLSDLAWKYADVPSFDPLPPLLGGQTLAFSLDWWDPRQLQREWVERTIIAEMTAQIRHRLDQVEEHARSLGMTPIAERRQLDVHLTWVVLRQQRGVSYRKIGDGAVEIDHDDQGKRQWETVSRAVKEVADLIELPLRAPARGGRPPKPRGGNKKPRN